MRPFIHVLSLAVMVTALLLPTIRWPHLGGLKSHLQPMISFLSLLEMDVLTDKGTKTEFWSVKTYFFATTK
jgi:hypothetical protein